MSKHHDQWFFKNSVLPPCSSFDGLQWPAGSNSEISAWSAFCAFIEFNQPIREKLTVSTKNLTPVQIQDAVVHARSLGWAVVVDQNSITLLRPPFLNNK